MRLLPSPQGPAAIVIDQPVQSLFVAECRPFFPTLESTRPNRIEHESRAAMLRGSHDGSACRCQARFTNISSSSD